jgi:hypothetical protein
MTTMDGRYDDDDDAIWAREGRGEKGVVSRARGARGRMKPSNDVAIVKSDVGGEGCECACIYHVEDALLPASISLPLAR